MRKPWVAAMGNLKGWLIAACVWTVAIGGYHLLTTSDWNRTRVRLDASLARVIRCSVPVQTVVGAFSDPGDAAEDYERAVQEYNGCDRYSGYFSIAAEKPAAPDSLDIRAPQYLLDGMKKARMDYTRRFAQRADWTAPWVPYVKAFDTIGQICTLKADLLARTDRTAEAETLLKAVIVFGYRIDQERVRFSQTITGVGLQKQAGRRLLQLYDDTRQAGKARTVQEFLQAIQEVQEQLESKAAATTARLQDGSPPPGEMFWLVDNDDDRMWRIEATLRLGLTQWTAPRPVDQHASRDRLQLLVRDSADPLVRDAAKAALETTRQDVHKVR